MDGRRSIALAMLLFLALSACRAIPAGLLDDDAETASEPSPTPITKTLCESGADLQTDVEFLRSVELSEDGLLTLIVSVDAALGEARTLALLAGQEYAPLATDLIVSLQDLRDIAEELEDEESLGGGIATIGEAITAVGESMEALGLQLREPCPQND